MTEPNVFPHEVARVVLALCDSHPGIVSDLARKAIKENNFAEIVRFPCNPADYSSSHLYKMDSAIIGFFKKCEGLPGLPSASQLEADAIRSFYDLEKTNFLTNKRLEPYLFGLSDQKEGVRNIILRARKWVKDVLGRVPPSLEGRFGPGATYGDKGFLSTLPDKINTHATQTFDCASLNTLWWDTAWGRACSTDRRMPSTVQGNRFTTVPKDSRKRRGICIEPSINVFYQLSVGSFFKKRLMEKGWDLNRAQDKHRSLAREASVGGAYFTMDLSNASDTICLNLVKLLLPTIWYDILSTLRSPKTLVKGKWIVLEKFSSMGNGYTFELETLIFSSLIHAVTGLELGRDFFVFGDDIIAPTEFYGDVAIAMKFFGFTVNPDKSFSEGPFRESCGGDFFRGVDVRPHFLKEIPDEPEKFIRWANGVRRMAGHDGFDSFSGSHLRISWYRILDAIPTNIRRLRGPRSFGDLVIHDDDKSKWITRHHKHDPQQLQLKVFMPTLISKRVDWKHFSPSATLASALYGCGDGALGVIPRKPVYSYNEAYIALIER